MFFVAIQDDDGVRYARVQALVDGEIRTLALFACLPGADACSFLARIGDLATGGCFEDYGGGESLTPPS